MSKGGDNQEPNEERPEGGSGRKMAHKDIRMRWAGEPRTLSG